MIIKEDLRWVDIVMSYQEGGALIDTDIYLLITYDDDYEKHVNDVNYVCGWNGSCK